jgi:hypothetical protein
MEEAEIAALLEGKLDLEHGDVIDVSMKLVMPNEWNPNEMSLDEFNMLSDNIHEVGFLDPVLVVPVFQDDRYRFRVVDGEHRYEAQRLRDAVVLRAVYTSPDRFDENTQKFQTVRMNKIRGKMNQKKFSNLVSDLMQSGAYTYDQLAHNFGFVDEDEFEHLIERTRESLPTEDMKKEFDKAKDDIKTVDDLSLVLNRLFTRYGDSLPYHFMVLDFGGKDHLWVRMKHSSYRQVVAQARNAMEAGVTFDSVLATVLSVMNMPKFVDKWRDRLDAPDPKQDETSIDDLIESDEDAA